MSDEFQTLHLDAAIIRALADLNYIQPTPVQAAAIPLAMQGHDLLVTAQTGSGKTAAYLLPVLQSLIAKSTFAGHGARALVLTPTRELAQQVGDNAQAYARYLPWFKSELLVGGMPFGSQIRALAKPLDVIVATPGRLMDHMRRGRLDFSRLEYLVLDEADRMLDMGFIDDIRAIVEALPENRQTFLFSATWDGIVGHLAQDLTQNAERVEIEHSVREGRIDERYYLSDDSNHKMELLLHLLAEEHVEQAVIFVATKMFTEELADRLTEEGYFVDALHGDLQQNQRNRILTRLRKGILQLLVATDVAARGIDIPNISHVFNYDIPHHCEDYVHRIGRTGRAGRHGQAITLVDVNELMLLRRIERYLKRSIPEEKIPGLEAKKKPRIENKRRFYQKHGKRHGDYGDYSHAKRHRREYDEFKFKSNRRKKS